MTPHQPPANSAKVLYGKVIPPQQQILIYSSGEWEDFIHEWAESRKPNYLKVVRLSGATDMGIDVAGLTDAKAFHGVWDNFQCKHYDAALTPSAGLPELGKMLWHSFNDEFAAPRSYTFMAPKGCGISLQRLLLNPANLKAKLFEKWNDWCSTENTAKQTILLEGDFLIVIELGDLIGKLCASHNWSIDRISNELPYTQAPSARFPRDWTVDVWKLACLLRCADAAAIDERRAPSFLFALTQPRNASFEHWNFQAKIRPAYVGRANGALVFESKMAFDVNSVDAWWLAYEAIEVADHELKKSRDLLLQSSSPLFAVDRVNGAGDPELLSRHLQVTGWRPVDTSIKVDDARKLANLLGGTQLYGSDPLVPIRELIQNAADANHVAGYAIQPDVDGNKHIHEERGRLIWDDNFIKDPRRYRPALAALIEAHRESMPLATAINLAHAILALSSGEVRPLLTPAITASHSNAITRGRFQLEAICFLALQGRSRSAVASSSEQSCEGICSWHRNHKGLEGQTSEAIR